MRRALLPFYGARGRAAPVARQPRAVRNAMVKAVLLAETERPIAAKIQLYLKVKSLKRHFLQRRRRYRPSIATDQSYIVATTVSNNPPIIFFYIRASINPSSL